MTTWRVGMKAVCLRSGIWFVDKRGEPRAKGPNPGEVSTVSEVTIDAGETFLTFREWPSHYEYDATEFRPAVSRPTDISIFKALLRDPHQQITEDA